MFTAIVNGLSNDIAMLKLKIEVLDEQSKDIKTLNTNIAEGIISSQKSLKRLEDGLLGDVNLNHDGLFVQVKKHLEDHDKLDKRVSIIEQLMESKEQLARYKKTLVSVIITVITAIVATLAWLVDKTLTFMQH